MARNAELLQARNKAIKEMFEKMRKRRADGSRRHVDDIIRELSEERFYISRRSIEGIIYGKGKA